MSGGVLIKVREHQGAYIIDLPERVFKGETANRLKVLLTELSGKGRNIAVNFERTLFVDSSVVTLLLMADKLTRSAQTRVFILKPSEQARELFHITNLVQIIPILYSEEGLT